MMPGFLVGNSKIECSLRNRFPERCVKQDIIAADMTIKRHTLNKFMDDKTFKQDDDCIVIIEGYLLNKKDLLCRYAADCVFALIKRMYNVLGEEFFSALRGAFSGAFYDKKKDIWLVFTCHTGENPIYYAIKNETFFAGSQVEYILEACKKEGISLSFDEDAAYQMLTYGFMANDSTYANEIKRLRGGTYLRIQEDKIVIKKYHEFTKHPERFQGYTEAQIIDALDRTFREAVSLEYGKDDEYGYKHLADMSGGLDSRMGAWVAHTLKPCHLQLLCYCKADYLDEKIAKKIAQYWKDELLVKPLDDCSFMYDVDENTAMLGGLSLYAGSTGAKRLWDSLNVDQYGLGHTGMIGDVVIGAYISSKQMRKNVTPAGFCSEKLKKRLHILPPFEDAELNFLYTRAIQGASNSQILRKNYTEMVSPFMYVELLQLCLDIPIEMRIDHRLYKKWIISKYPDAAKYKWETTGTTIYKKNFYIFLHRTARRGIKAIQWLFGNRYSRDGMNPLDYWLSNDSSLQQFMDNYVGTTSELLKAYIPSHVMKDLLDLYRHGKVEEKTLSMTLLSAAKMYFCS